MAIEEVVAASKPSSGTQPNPTSETNNPHSAFVIHLTYTKGDTFFNSTLSASS